jgi:hypothetical protein
MTSMPLTSRKVLVLALLMGTPGPPEATGDLDSSKDRARSFEEGSRGSPSTGRRAVRLRLSQALLPGPAA